MERRVWFVGKCQVWRFRYVWAKNVVSNRIWIRNLVEYVKKIKSSLSSLNRCVWRLIYVLRVDIWRKIVELMCLTWILTYLNIKTIIIRNLNQNLRIEYPMRIYVIRDSNIFSFIDDQNKKSPVRSYTTKYKITALEKYKKKNYASKCYSEKINYVHNHQTWKWFVLLSWLETENLLQLVDD